MSFLPVACILRAFLRLTPVRHPFAHCLSDLRNRVVHHGVEPSFAGREVGVDGRADKAARRAISAMLTSGSLANASSAASRIAWTLRPASERRRLCVVAGVVSAISVDRHRCGLSLQLRQELPRTCGGTTNATRLTTLAGIRLRTRARLLAAALATAERAGQPAAMSRRSRSRSCRRPVAGRVEAGDHPRLLASGRPS